MDVGNQDLIKVEGMKSLPCYSAECFVTETNITENVIFDMELHSLALICDMYNIELLSIKKITDNLSIKDYYKNLDTENIFELESGLELIRNIL